MKKAIFVILLTMLTFLSGCSKYSTPNSLMSVPVLKNGTGANGAMASIVSNFLPVNSEILTSDEMTKGKPVISVDLDNDKSNEIVAFFKYENQMKKGFMLLKKNKNNNWENVYEKVVECNKISEFDCMNIMDKKRKSLLIGFSISDLAGCEYHSYTLLNGKIEDKYMGVWNRFDIINTPENNGRDFTVGVWNEQQGYMDADVIRFNSSGAAYDNEFYKSYAPKILDYFNNFSNGSFYDNQSIKYAWYGTIKAEIKTGNADAALNNLNKIEEYCGDEYSFKLYKAQVYELKKQYSDALEILADAVRKISFAEESHPDSTLKYTVLDAKRQLMYLYTEEGKIYAAKGSTKDAEEMFDKAQSVFHELDKNNYYGKNQSISIYKDIDINMINSEMEKIKE